MDHLTYFSGILADGSLYRSPVMPLCEMRYWAWRAYVLGLKSVKFHYVIS